MIAWPSTICFSFLAYKKFQLSEALNSRILHEDALCSALGAILSGVVIFAGFAERGNFENAWKADPLAGCIIALALLGEGCKVLYDFSDENFFDLMNATSRSRDAEGRNRGGGSA